MSFEPIKFVYTPPPTIPPLAVFAPTVNPVGTAVSVSTEFGSTAAANSNAAALVTRLKNLSATSAYLQSAILSLVPTLGVNFDLAANPDLGRALAQVYNTNEPPSAMNMPMYTQLLSADISFQQFDILNPPLGSSVQIQPLQRANVSLITKTFENTLIKSGQYDQTLPVLLRSLSGDQTVFTAMTAAISGYPILAVPQLTPAQLATSQTPTGTSSRDLNGASTDVSDSLAGTLNAVLDQWTNSYAGIYQVVATPDPTETALPSVVATLSSQPSSDLTRLSTMLTNLIATEQQPAIQNAHDSVDNLIVPRLLSDVTSHATNLDYMMQIAVTPSASFTSLLGGVMATLSSINPGSILNVGLTGSVGVAAGGFNPPPLTPAQSQTVAGLPEGLQILGANISWAQSSATNQSALIQSSIQRLGLRRMTNQGNTTEFLTSLKSLSSSVGIINALLQSGANTPASSGNSTSLNTGTVSPNTSLQSFGTLISSLPSQSGSSYALDGNTLTIIPPAIPVAPPNVQAVLAQGGVKQVTTQTLQTQVNFTV